MGLVSGCMSLFIAVSLWQQRPKPVLGPAIEPDQAMFGPFVVKNDRRARGRFRWTHVGKKSLHFRH